MNKSSVLNERTQLLAADFLQRFEIRSMKIAKGVGITKSTEISDISIFLIKQQDDQNLDYCIEFKLQNEGADICQYLTAVTTVPEFSIALTQQCQDRCKDIVNDKICGFVDIIRERVKSSLKEQKVQDITFVGNTFILNNSTKFTVLSDEGDGRLNIEVLTKEKPLDAKLTASGLLDGLYLGSIKLVDTS